MEASDRKELRVILDNINVLNDEWFDTFQTDEGQTSIHDMLEYEIMKADKILAAPPRNCDVGTAEEQTHRMLLYCKAHGVDENRCFRCQGCPLLTADICELAWAQMPYDVYEKGKCDEQK